MKGRILVVDDDVAMCDILVEALGGAGFEVAATTRPAEALARLRGEDFDVVVADLNMPGQSGLGVCQEALALHPDLPVILITAFGSMETAIEALRAGAWDFVPKPLDPDALARTAGRAVEVRALRREVQTLRRAVAVTSRFGELIGESLGMQELFATLERVTDTDATILVRGETGTGKELVARAIHQRSARRAGPFVPVNCGAIPEGLVESELFGHVRGAFTDARGPRRGLLFEADGGTLFLDEVGELPLAIQPRLLRALQERRARPVGADRELPFDARVVAATNRDLAAGVAAGHFRADLYYRLDVVGVEIPPLRERSGDTLLLAQHALEVHAARMRRPVATISPAAAERLLAWPWPGNVRELFNAIERAVALARSEQIAPEDLPEPIRAASLLPALASGALLTLEAVERHHILHVLDLVGGSKARAARILGVDRATLYRKLERYRAR